MFLKNGNETGLVMADDHMCHVSGGKKASGSSKKRELRT